ncbi:MAG: hypothetical protein JW726_18445, partial [Anaerolineales bacterium]|nr:hypothetical protein [Anaerolineales bacterium]
MVVTKPILVVTSTPGFGELIQQSLEETGRYQAFLVDSSKEALALTNVRPFSLAILDSDLADADFPVLVQSLRQVQERLCLIVIPPDNNPLHPLLASIPFDGYLAKPFYLPDLLDTVAEVLDTQTEPTPALSKASPSQASVHASHIPEQALEWLKDVNRAAQHLTRLSLESSAQAALIIRQAELWAYAGQLSQPAAQELASAVARFWIDSRPPISAKASRSVDMVRVVHLIATGSDYMLYVTSLGREMVLALAFDAETPFSTIRAQVNFLARSLVSPEQNRPANQPASPPSPRAVDLPQKQFTPSPVSFWDGTEEDDIEELEGDMPPVNLMPLLDDVPLPDPKKPSPHRTSSEQDASLPGKPSFLAQSPSPRQVDSAARLFPDMEELSLMPGMEVVEEELRPITPA